MSKTRPRAASGAVCAALRCAATAFFGLSVAVSVASAPAASAQNCAPGFVLNPYTAQCLAPVTTPVINGIPCVPSNIGLCSSFVQNQQPRQAPRPVA